MLDFSIVCIRHDLVGEYLLSGHTGRLIGAVFTCQMIQ